MDPQELSELLSSLQEKSDHDLLIGLNVQMRTVLERLEKGDICLGGHETRLGRLESFQNYILGACAVIAFVVPLIWDKVKTIFGGS